jgi:hypothetical protein
MNLSKTTLLLLAIAAVAVMFATSAAADPGNDNWQEAQDVYDGNQIDMTVAAAGGGNPADEDWFRVYMTEGQFLKVGMVFDPQNGLAGIYVYGPDDHTREIAQSHNDNINANEIDTFIFGNGTYYIRVHCWGNGATDAMYRMWIRVLTPQTLTDEQRVSNSGVPLVGGIDSSMWYRIWLDGGNQSVQMADISTSWSDDTDAHLMVYDRKDDYALNILNYSWSRNLDHNEKCRFAASYSGYYYLRVYQETLTTNNNPVTTTFSLTVDILDSMYRADGNVERADAQLVTIRETVRGKLNQAYDTHQWYMFYLNKDEQFSAKASFINGKLTTHWDYYNLTLYTHNGTILTGANNAGSTGAPISSCSIFQGRAPYTGLYYMSLSALYSFSGSGTTDYTQGKLVNAAKFEIDVLIPNRRVWVKDPPGEVRFDEDNEYVIDLSTIFWDPEGDELTYGTTGGKVNFTMPLSQSTGLLTIRPMDNWYGTDEITIWAHDGRPDQKNSTTVTVNVRSVPDPPYVRDAAPSIVRINEDEVNTTALDLYDVFGDVDIEDKFLIFSSDKNEDVNIEIHQTSGQVTLWGAENYNGEVRLTFYATDSYNYRVSHDLRVIVNPTNDAPIPTGKISRESWDEGTNFHIDVNQYFFDIDEDDLYYYAEWDPVDAVSFDNADSNPLNSWFDIYPEDPNFYGYIQVTFRAYDRDKLDPDEDPEVAVQTAIFEIKNVNDAPRIDAWTPDYDNPVIKETESQVFTVPQNLIYDVDSTSFKWRWFVNDVEMVDATGESFEFPSEPGYDDEGLYLIRCEIKDSLGEPALTSPEWVLTIENQNRAPTVYLISKDSNVEEGGDIRLRADGNDPDDDSLIFEWFSIDEAGREHSIGLGRDFTYDEPLLPGSYRFKCKISDGESEVGSEQIQVDVIAHEFPPTVPGFGTFVMLAAMVGGLAMAVAIRRKA